jgi:hypothetical protein
MPYFNDENVNLLLIHIPKTGGSSLEQYFSKKYNIKLNNKSLYGFLEDEKLYSTIKINSSLQHITYNDIMKYKDFFKLNTNNLDIITIVRNPYDRAISDLFHYSKININSSKEDVYNALKIHLFTYNDNHTLPQNLFITDENNNLLNNIKILRTENLNNNMLNIGYTDFNINYNSNGISSLISYYNYLNKDSINLINTYYKKDFELFNYNIIYE